MENNIRLGYISNVVFITSENSSIRIESICKLDNGKENLTEFMLLTRVWDNGDILAVETCLITLF